MHVRLAAAWAGLAVAALAGSSPAVAATTTEATLCERVDSFTTSLVRGDQADVYYPVPTRPGNPVIAFLQGGLTDKSAYAGFARALACSGYVVVIPNHYVTLNPAAGPQLFASQQMINDVHATMVLSNANPVSPVYGLVDTEKLGVSGHSFGGAAALFAVDGRCQFPFCFGFYARPPQLKAAAVYGVNTFVGPAPIDVNTAAVPSALIQGSLDGRATMARAQATFAIMEKTKAFITIDGLNHWGIADVQNPPGNPPDPNAQTRPYEWGIAKTAKYARLVFDAYLKGDAGALRQLRFDRGEKSVDVQLVE